jgi:hypothetical protein
MRFGLVVAVALAAASFATATFATVRFVTPGPTCNLAYTKAWVPSKGQAYLTEAYSNGGACADAVVTIVVRAQRRVLWVEAMPASQVMTFVEAKTPARMKAALVDWLGQPHMFRTTGDLPAWKNGADAPDMLGEFPFYPEEGVDQVTYEQIRAAKQTIFCYVQGMESMACIAISKDGAATKVGVQSFPG